MHLGISTLHLMHTIVLMSYSDILQPAYAQVRFVLSLVNIFCADYVNKVYARVT